MMALAQVDVAAFLVTGASLLMGGLLLGLWRVSVGDSGVRERFLLLASLAQFAFALHQMPLFFAPPTWDGAIGRSFFATLFGLYIALTLMVANLLKQPAIRGLHRVLKGCLWLMFPACWFVFGIYDFTGYVTSNYAHHRLTVNNLVALTINAALAAVLIRKFYLLQAALLQSRMDAAFAAERAKLTERQRIMSDLHDSVGSQLVGLLSMVRAGSAHTVLEKLTADALLDLRLTVDALQPINGNLAVVLAMLRHRLQERLSSAGITLLWQVDDLPRMSQLSPSNVQHIQRIVQEAFSNVVQHAKASEVRFSAQHDPATAERPAAVVIALVDNGVGIPEGAQGAGQGLAGMQRRAQHMGASLLWKTQHPAGLRMEMRLPM